MRQIDVPTALLLRYLQTLWAVADRVEILNEFGDTDRFGLMIPIGYSGVERDLEQAYTSYAITLVLDEPSIPIFFDDVGVKDQQQRIPTPTACPCMMQLTQDDRFALDRLREHTHQQDQIIASFQSQIANQCTAIKLIETRSEEQSEHRSASSTSLWHSIVC